MNDETEYKKVLIKTFEAFIDFCKTHNIHFVAAYGTVLGAVRHKGLIPWDDDIDVMMDRRNYERFVNLKSSPSLGHYEICCHGDKHYPYPFAKFCDATTTVMESFGNLVFKCVHGVYIDVFPIDEVGEEERAKVLKRRYRRVTHKYQTGQICILPNEMRLVFPGLKKLYYRLLRRYLSKRMLKMERLIAHERGDKMMYYRSMIPYENSLLEKSWIYDTIDVAYEQLTIPIPRDYDAYLSRNYGDYMTPPPPEQRLPHLHTFVDLS